MSATDDATAPQETLHRQLEQGRRLLRGDLSHHSPAPLHQPRSLTMRYLLSCTEPSPRLLLALSALMAAVRLFRAIRAGRALLMSMRNQQTPDQARLRAPPDSYSALPSGIRISPASH